MAANALPNPFLRSGRDRDFFAEEFVHVSSATEGPGYSPAENAATREPKAAYIASSVFYYLAGYLIF
jgi:hypothetical protein